MDLESRLKGRRSDSKGIGETCKKVLQDIEKGFTRELGSLKGF
jgi:hypothetical protein